MKLVVLGHVGTDAGYWVFENGHWVHVGGWGIEAMAEVSRALKIIAETPALKTPGLAEATTKQLSEFVTKELGERLGAQGATTVVIMQAGR
jgi:hypothetical protein